MEMLDLQTFMAVAESEGITRATRALNTVASNVTTRIKGLEAEIGVPLFARHSRGMMLTEAGQRLLPYARQLLALSAEALASTRDDGVARGPLNIGSMETTAAVRLPALLAYYHRAHPEVKIMLVQGPQLTSSTACWPAISTLRWYLARWRILRFRPKLPMLNNWCS
jgi:DNA-binding transcriptional LysR family regulator